MKTMSARRFRGGPLAIAAAALVLAVPAPAASLAGPDVNVRYTDLDIDTVDGATELLNRIKAAADRVCAPLDHGDIASRANRGKCHLKLTAAAVSKVDHPVLASVYKTAYPDAPSLAAVSK
jgi:UrcA family protein